MSRDRPPLPKPEVSRAMQDRPGRNSRRSRDLGPPCLRALSDILGLSLAESPNPQIRKIKGEGAEGSSTSCSVIKPRATKPNSKKLGLTAKTNGRRNLQGSFLRDSSPLRVGCRLPIHSTHASQPYNGRARATLPLRVSRLSPGALHMRSSCRKLPFRAFRDCSSPRDRPCRLSRGHHSPAYGKLSRATISSR